MPVQDGIRIERPDISKKQIDVRPAEELMVPDFILMDDPEEGAKIADLVGIWNRDLTTKLPLCVFNIFLQGYFAEQAVLRNEAGNITIRKEVEVDCWIVRETFQEQIEPFRPPAEIWDDQFD